MAKLNPTHVNKSNLNARAGEQTDVHTAVHADVRSKRLVQGAIIASLALGVGLLVAPVIRGLLEQRKLLRRPKGRVVKAPFAIEVEPESAYD